ncbi:hypothetical protein LCGC14_1505370, partial [marine sediment metagenome]
MATFFTANRGDEFPPLPRTLPTIADPAITEAAPSPWERGLTLGGETGYAGQVRACQARVFSDLDITIEPTPHSIVVTGEVIAIETLAKDTVAVTIRTKGSMDILAGQYCRLKFKGFPERSFSPTANLKTGSFESGVLRFHIKQVADGRVTPHLGTRIGTGHKVRIEGPLGHAFHRTDRDNRLVLVGTGTGFAPIWAITSAALSQNPDRKIALSYETCVRERLQSGSLRDSILLSEHEEGAMARRR